MKWYNKDFDYIHEFIESWNRKLKKLKRTFIVIAILSIAAGALCIFAPMETFAAVKLLVAVALVAHGVSHIVSFASTTQYFQDPMQLVMGVINILLGILVFFTPVMLTVTSFTFLFAFLLLFSGAERIAFASKLKYYRIMNTGVMTFCGVLDIVLAIAFFILPLASILVLNYIVAAYLIVSGIALFIEALSMKKI